MKKDEREKTKHHRFILKLNSYLSFAKSKIFFAKLQFLENWLYKRNDERSRNDPSLWIIWTIIQDADGWIIKDTTMTATFSSVGHVGRIS